MPKQSGHKKAFAVVGFLEENTAEVIPTEWIISSSEAKWPNLSSPYTISKYIQERKPVANDWITVRIKIYGYSNSFKKAKQMAETALETSHISSDSSEEDHPRKRRRPARYQSSDEEPSDENSQSLLQIKKFNIPKPPEEFLNETSRIYPSVSSLNLSETQMSKASKRVLSDTPVLSKETRNDFHTTKPTNETIFAHILEYLEKLNSKFSDLERKMDKLSSQLEKFTRGADSESGVCHIELLPPELQQLPVKTEEQLKELNEILKKKKDLSVILVRYLHSHGTGKTASSFILSISKKVLAQDVAMLYSRYGRKGKKPFSQFNETMNVIIAAAAIRFKDVHREVLSDMFGKALAGASDWNGRKSSIQ